jgi:gamma-glutamyltranspeptidase/glutathione hydrolase
MPISKYKYPSIGILLLFLYCCANNNGGTNNPPEFLDRKAISGFGAHAMIAGSSGKPALEAGLQVLREGGNACDAALTAALDQVTRAAGAWVSFGGVMSLVYYQAATGKVFTLSAPFKTPFEETDPMTIPRQPTPSGRTALVPGFLGGILAAHDKLGSVPRERIFAPAIKTAEEGFQLSNSIYGLFQYRWNVLSRLPETRRIFEKADGSSYRPGDTFIQPVLAQTLKAVSRQGADYFYRGEWADKFVEIVRREGGRMIKRDLEEYSPVWSEAAHTSYYGYDAYAVNYPCLGGASLIAGLNMMEAAGLDHISGHASNPDSFCNLVRIARVGYYMTFLYDFFDFLQGEYPGRDFSTAAMLEKSTAQFFWNLIATGTWDELVRKFSSGGSSTHSAASGHSDALVAFDSMGNAAVISHTINTTDYGTTGIFVDGISIPDSGSMRQPEMKLRGAGQYLTDAMASLLLTKDGRPFLGCGSPGGSIRELTLQHVQSIVHDRLDPARAIARRVFYGPGTSFCQRIKFIDFPSSFVEAVEEKGVCLENAQQREDYWVGILFDPGRGLLGGAPALAPYDPGIAAY